MYTITEISKRFQLPPSTIRYYEKIGLLENVIHKDGYHRLYDDSHIDRLQAIECFKKALLPLSEIREFFEYEKDIQTNSDAILKMMENQKKKTLEAMANLQAGLDHMEKKVTYYTLVNEAIEAGKPIPSWSDIMK